MNIKRKMLLLLTLCLVISSMAIGVFAEEAQTNGNTLYVDASIGDDETGDGSASNPYKTFKNAVLHSVSTDTIYLKKGTYDATPQIKVGAGGSAAANSGTENLPDMITIEGEDLTGTIIKDLEFGPNNAGQTVTLKNLTIESTTSDNFVFMGHYGSSSTIDLTLIKCISKNTNGVWNRRWAELYGNLTVKNTVIDGNTGTALIGNFNSPIETYNFENDLIISNGGRGIIDGSTSGNFVNTIFIGKSLYNLETSTFTSCAFSSAVTDAPDNTYALEYDTNYNITNFPEVWTNTGIGTNPDATQANLGVYGGEYAWGDYQPLENLTLDIEAPSYEIDGGTTFETYAVIKGASNIYAEDMNIDYDESLFEFLDAEIVNSEGLKIYYNDTSVLGKLRFIVSSISAQYGLNDTSNILKITFKAKNIDGSGDILIESGLVADGNGVEIVPICSGKTFTVNRRNYGDVNNDGKFSLGDLAIAGRLMATLSDQWGSFEPDVDYNGSVEDLDLTTIVQSIIDSENQ